MICLRPFVLWPSSVFISFHLPPPLFPLLAKNKNTKNSRPDDVDKGGRGIHHAFLPPSDEPDLGQATLLFRSSSGRDRFHVVTTDDSPGDDGFIIDSLVVLIEKTALLAEQDTALASTAEFPDVRLAQPGADRLGNLLRLMNE